MCSLDGMTGCRDGHLLCWYEGGLDECPACAMKAVLRDYLAGQALAASEGDIAKGYEGKFAAYCYRLADDMLKVR